MRLDLCDREGKYSNGFCHWPQPAWRKPDGTWVHAPAPVLSTAPAAAHVLVRTSIVHRDAKHRNPDEMTQIRAPMLTQVPSQANFTSLATPDAIGSGKTALATLLHEGEPDILAQMADRDARQ